jgi:hypothetical protein
MAMSDKEFNEWLESTRPRPGAGDYPALPIDLNPKSAKRKGKRGRPRTHDENVKRIETVISRPGVRNLDYWGMISFAAKELDMDVGNLNRHYKPCFLPKRRGGAKNT